MTTQPHRVHIAIVSDQPGPNLYPLLDSRLHPDEVILLTPPGARYAEFELWFRQVLRPRGIRASSIALDSCWDSEVLREAIETVVDQRLAEGHQLCLNTSCGPRPISIIAHEVFFYRDLPVFYLHNDWVRWLCRPNQEQDFNLEDRLKIPALLESRGMAVRSLQRTGIPQALRDVGHHIIDNIEHYSSAIGILNYYAQQADRQLRITLREGHDKGHTPFQELLEILQAAEIVTVKGNQLEFCGAQERFFANGGWLEDLVFSELFNLRSELPELQDVARSVEIDWLDSPKKNTVSNELDVVVLYNNRLLVIECKTKRFKEGSANASIYKLGSLLKQLGGLRTKGMLVSYQSIKPIHKARGPLMDIQVCDRDNLSQLREQLRRCLLSS